MPSDPSTFLDALPAGVERSNENPDRFRVNGVEPSLAVRPESIEQLAACLAAASHAGQHVVPVGCASQLDFGRPPSAYDIALRTDGLDRVIAHEAADLTVTVEAGITIASLNAQLASHGQHLALDPPHPEHATIGAILATDACGPFRYAHGKARDLLIGVTVGLGDGKIVKGGGRVVKNVAGYDLMKLFIGSHGTLGVIASASFKLKPLPAHRITAAVVVDDFDDALARCLSWRDAPIEPVLLEALDSSAAARCGLDGHAAIVGFAGSEREVSSQLEELRRREPRCAPLAHSHSHAGVYEAVRDFRCVDDATTWVAKLSRPAGQLGEAVAAVRRVAIARDVRCAVAAHAGSGVAWLRLEHDDVSHVARLVTSLREDGLAMVLSRIPRAAQSRVDPWGPLPAPALQRGIKQVLDPTERMSPRRLV